MSKEPQNDDGGATTGSANSAPVGTKDHFKDSLEAVKNKRPSQPSNCYIIKKVPVDIILEIGDHLPLSAKICLRNTCSGLLNLLRHPGWPDKDHLDAYHDLVDFYTGLAFEKGRPGLWLLVACAYCKDHHDKARFSEEELGRSSFERKCLGADLGRSLRISNEVDLTWEGCREYLKKEGHEVLRAPDHVTSDPFSFKWSHIIHMNRDSEVERALSLR